MRAPRLGLSILLVAAGAAAEESDFSEVTVKSTRLAEHLYMLSGAGGNIAASVGADGVLLVDDEFAPLAYKIRAALKELGADDKPVRFVINTHYHYDHTGGNLPLAQSGTTVIAHEQLRPRYAAGGTAGNGGSLSRAMPAGAPADQDRARARRARRPGHAARVPANRARHGPAKRRS